MKLLDLKVYVIQLKSHTGNNLQFKTSKCWLSQSIVLSSHCLFPNHCMQFWLGFFSVVPVYIEIFCFLLKLLSESYFATGTTL